MTILPRSWTAAAAAVLAGSGHENAVYELGGPLLTYDDLGQLLSTTLGREVPVAQVDDATYGEILAGAGVPGFVVPILVDIQRGIKQGGLEVPSDDLARLLGRKPTPLAQVLSQIVNSLSVAV